MRKSALLFQENNKPTTRFAHFLRDMQIPGEDLAGIDGALQARFFQKRTGTQDPLERWELEKIEVKCPQEVILTDLAALGFINRTDPSKQLYDRAGWPGAMAVRAGARLLDLIAAWEAGVRWNELVVFAGARPLDEAKETCAAAYAAVNIKSTILSEETWKMDKTECAMMQHLWTVTPLPSTMRQTPIQFVNAPMKPNPKPDGPPIRPNSEDPVHLWLAEQKPTPGTMLFSSGAPYGVAQDEAMWMILGPLGHEIETFGHVAPYLPIEAYMREVAGAVNRIRRARGL